MMGDKKLLLILLNFKTKKIPQIMKEEKIFLLIQSKLRDK
jgi:hypothetical protein